MLGRRVVGLLLALIAMASVGPVSAGNPEERHPKADDSLPVICPAITGWHGFQGNGPFPCATGADLIVIGRWSKLDKYHATVSVEEVLFGALPEMTLTCSRYGLGPTNKRAIFQFAAYPYPDEPWILDGRREATPANLAGARALSKARFSFYTLAASTILVGREISFAQTDDISPTVWTRFVRNVRVSRVMKGPGKLKGGLARIVVERCIYRSDGPPHLPAGEKLYFIGPGREFRESDESTPRRQDPARPPFLVAGASLPASFADRVQATLATRDSHPVVEQATSNGKRRVRRIFYPGPAEEALTVLASDFPGAAALAASSLTHHHEESRVVVVTAIKKRLHDPSAGETGSYRRQRNLIKLLSGFEQGHAQGDLKELIDQSMARIQQDDPPAPPRREVNRWGYEAQMVDLNHSLTWLLLGVGEEQARISYGSRLMALREQASGGWKDEVEYALATLRVQEDMEILEALERTESLEGFRSVRSEPRAHVLEKARFLAFSHDGQTLAIWGSGDGVRLWETKTWSPRAFILLDEGVSDLVFSPEDRFVYVVGGAGGRQIHARYHVETGKLDQAYEGHRSRIGALQLSPDGHTMATLSYDEDRVLFWDSDSGNVLRVVPFRGFSIHASPDGTGVLLSEGPDDWDLEPWREGETGIFRLPKEKPRPWKTILTPSYDGKVLCHRNRLGPHPPDGTSVELALYHWTESGYEELSRLQTESPSRFLFVAVSPDRKLLAAGGKHNVLRLFSIPAGKKVAEFCLLPCGHSETSLFTFSFSPDSRFLAVATGRAMPSLIRLDGFEKLTPWPAHGGAIRKVMFTADGRRLRTVAWDNTVCTWDADTLRLIRRVMLPERFEVASMSRANSNVLFCVKRETFGADWQGRRPAKVVHAFSGEVLLDTSIPEGFARGYYRSEEKLHWLPGGRALVLIGDDAEEWGRLDLTSGSFTRMAKAKIRGRSRFSEDGKHIFAFGHPMKATWEVELDRIDVKTGAIEEIRPSKKERVPAQRCGLVPGGRFFWLADHDVYIFDRATCELVAHKRFQGADPSAISFSADGSRYALSQSREVFTERVRKRCGADAKLVFRVIETISGKTLFARPCDVQSRFGLSPDGRRIVLVATDGTLRMWTLPKPR